MGRLKQFESFIFLLIYGSFQAFLELNRMNCYLKPKFKRRGQPIHN